MTVWLFVEWSSLRMQICLCLSWATDSTMSIRLNRRHLSDQKPSPSSVRHLQYGSKEDVGFSRLFHFFHQAFPLAFTRDTFQRVYDASDISRTAYHSHCCCRLKIDAALLATSTFDSHQKRQLKILMLVEDDRSRSAFNLGKRLLTQLIDTCKELENIHLIYAFVESTNLDGIHFYKTMGFEQREFLHDYFPQRASLTPDAIKLEYRIGTSVSNESSDHTQTMLSPVSTKYNVGVQWNAVCMSIVLFYQESPSEFSQSTNSSEVMSFVTLLR